MRLSVILVHYHAAELAAKAHAALAADAAASGLELEHLLVDNGSTPAGREILRALPGRLLEPDENLGYAGGANLGARESTGEALVLMNPDVLVRPGCLAALAAALGSGAAAAGPRFYWDPEGRFLLPPTEVRGRWPELRAVLAARGLLVGSALRAWRRHAYRSWRAAEPYRSFELSGALLAIRRDAWQETGPFDEGYRLYFEETDWLLRLRVHGGEARFVPGAEATHLYARSSRGESRAAAWFEASARRFRRKHYGAAFARLLESLAPRPAAEPEPVLPLEALEPPAAAAQAEWLEWSASPGGVPAAGCPLAGRSDAGRAALAAAAELAAPGRYFLRWVSRDGRDMAKAAIEVRKPAG